MQIVLEAEQLLLQAEDLLHPPLRRVHSPQPLVGVEAAGAGGRGVQVEK